MISGVWTSAEFRANSQAVTFLGKEISKRSGLLTAIETALDTLHAQSEESAMSNLELVEDACRNWIKEHPMVSATPTPGKKISKRLQAIEKLQRQMADKRPSLYAAAPLNIGPNGEDPRQAKSRAAFHQELLEATVARARRLGHTDDELNTEQLGYLAAKAVLKVDHVIDPQSHARCKVEAMRVLCAMLSKNRTLAQQFNTAGVEVIVVPANRVMTDLPEFASLKGVDISQDSGTPRTWDPTRGVGGLTVERDGVQKMYVAITEENLLGTQVAPEVAAVGGGCYEARYSTTSHEFAHGLHVSSAMTVEQKATITRCFEAKKRAHIHAATGVIVIDDPTLQASEVALNALFSVEWADGPRKAALTLTAAKSYFVYKSGNYVQKPEGGHLQFTTRHELKDCYSAFDEREYFAQLVNAYLGANGGTDPYTGRPRHNGQAWVRANERVEMVNLLDELFSAGTHSHFGQSQLDNTNVDDGADETTVGDYIRAHVKANPKPA